MNKQMLILIMLLTLAWTGQNAYAEQWIVQTSKPDAIVAIQLKSIPTSDLYLVETELDEVALLAIDGITSVERNSEVTLPDEQQDVMLFETFSLQAASYPFPFGMQQVRVAVLDTGVNETEARLIPYLEKGISLIPTENVQDLNGHGTKVSYLITDQAPTNIRIVPIKIMNRIGRTSIYTVIEGLYAAKEQQVSIINLSFGAIVSSETLNLAITDLTTQGITVVAAVGNSGGVGAYYPARYENVIGVGSYDEEGAIASFSQTGEGVDVFVIGTNMNTIDLDGNNIYGKGTSLSSAYMTKQLASYETLLLREKPHWKSWLSMSLEDRLMIKLQKMNAIVLSMLNEDYELLPTLQKSKRDSIIVHMSKPIDERSIQLGTVFALLGDEVFPVEVSNVQNKFTITPEKDWQDGVQLYITTHLLSEESKSLRKAVSFTVGVE